MKPTEAAPPADSDLEKKAQADDKGWLLVLKDYVENKRFKYKREKPAVLSPIDFKFPVGIPYGVGNQPTEA